MQPSRLTGWFVLLTIAVLTGAPAFADCTKSLTLRETPGGDAEPAQLVECDERETPALLEPGAATRLCDPKALAEAGVAFEDCTHAVAAAREGLRQAKIRAALQKGEDEAAIAERYGASESELDALSASAELSGPIPTSADASGEAAQ